MSAPDPALHSRISVRFRSAPLCAAVALMAYCASCPLPIFAGTPDTVYGNGFENSAQCAFDPTRSDFEVPGNGLDDDCDGSIDEPADVCDAGLPSNSNNAVQYAAALDLCQAAPEVGGQWGLISASLTLASGSGNTAAQSRSIRPNFGSGNSPDAGSSFAVFSTGSAAVPGQTSPPHFAPQPGSNAGTQSAAPADWLAANGGTFPNAPGCPPGSGPTAYDPVMLTLRVRVPDNAQSFKLHATFLSSEYPEYVCTAFNDVFVALLDSTFAGSPANPADENLATHRTQTGLVYPLGVGLAFNNTGLFNQCINGVTGCAGGIPGNTNSCVGTAGIVGTGLDLVDAGTCNTNSRVGGATSRLTIRGNVVPGEVVTLRLAVWDTSDALYDSTVLLDAFRWSTTRTIPGANLD